MTATEDGGKSNTCLDEATVWPMLTVLTSRDISRDRELSGHESSSIARSRG